MEPKYKLSEQTDTKTQAHKEEEQTGEMFPVCSTVTDNQQSSTEAQ